MSKSKKTKESRLRRLSLAPISPEDALRGAMEVPPPANDTPKPNPKNKAAKRKRHKAKKRKQ